MRAPIQDFGIPTTAQMREALDLLDAAIARGHRVYLHCYAGIGRTGTVVGCYLVRHGLGGRAALDEIAALRGGLGPEARPSPITPEQRRMVLTRPEADERV
jgi:protein-tyrosine phosphatase